MNEEIEQAEWEAGTELAVATGDVDWGVSGNGNVQLCTLMKITEGPRKGRFLSSIVTFSEGKGTEMAVKALRAMGWTGNDPSKSLEGITNNTVELVIELAVSVSGRTYPSVKFVNRPGSMAMMKFSQPASLAQIKMAGAMAAATAVMFPAVSAQPEPQQQPPMRQQQPMQRQQQQPPMRQQQPMQRQQQQQVFQPDDEYQEDPDLGF
jgi:hypothetical protein